ncbi:MAG: ATP-binding cassette domain-containing protein, partial [Clostridia bacterium]|nr:ATP-binding cassette domain-containing protein [Clostridia bacterium]
FRKADFTIDRNVHCALIGANGSGKSTLLQIIDGQLKPDRDSKIDGIKDAKICYMPQSSYAFDMSLKSNVFLGCPARFKEKDRVFYNNRIFKLIDDMGLWKLRFKNAAKLSGGETQRMALCRTLVQKHDILLLDEPTSAMDISATATAENVLSSYIDEYSPTLIFATHSLKQAERIADTIIFLKDGKIVEYGTSEILENPSSQELKEFLQQA